MSNLEALPDTRTAPAPTTTRARARWVYGFIVPLTLALAFLFFFWLHRPQYQLGAVLVLMLFRWFALGSPAPSTPINVPLLVLWVALAVGLAITPAPRQGVETAALIVTGTILVFGLYDTVTRERTRWAAIAGMVIVSAVAALLIPFIVLVPVEKLFEYPEWYLRLVPPTAMINSNQYAGALEASVPLALSLIIGSRLWRIAGLICLPILLLGLLLLQSRGAVIGLAVGLLVFGALYNRWLLPLAIGAIVALLVVNYGLGSPIPIPAVIQLSQRTAETNVLQRIEMWQLTSQWLVSHPLGLGIGGYSLYFDSLLGDQFDTVWRPHAHQLFLQSALDAGYVGLIAFVAAISYAILGLWGSLSRRTSPHLFIALLAAWVVILIHGMIDTVYWQNRASLVIWFVLGMSITVAREGMRRKRHHARETPDSAPITSAPEPT